MTATRDILSEEADKLIAELIENYDRLGLRASGSWAQSLIKEVGSQRMQIFGAHYTFQLQNGRQPTSQGAAAGNPTLREKILEWIRVKPITPRDPRTTIEQLAFLIARKIHRDGIQVPNEYNAGGLVSDVITQERINQIVQRIQLGEVESIKSEVIKLLKVAA